MSDRRTDLLSLSQFLRGMREKVRQQYPDTYWVAAETAGIKNYRNAIFFDLLELKDGEKSAQIRAAAFLGEGIERIRAFEQETGQQFVDGLKIGARFRVSFHPVSGMSLILCEIDAEMTLGGIERQRQKVLKNLLSRYPGHIRLVDGIYRTFNKELRLPAVIQKIAVISSSNAEGYHDLIHTLEHNGLGLKFHVRLFPVTVQGAQAVHDMIDAFRQIYESGVAYDAILLIRGGGAPGDLLPFDDERLGAVIARARFPVITGIGHHNNQSVCDLMAAIHEKTPTAAAKFLIERAAQFKMRIGQLSDMIGKTALGRIRDQQHYLIRYSSLVRIQVYHQLKARRRELDTMLPRIIGSAQQNLERDSTRVSNLSQLISNLSPQRTLQRGFAIVQRGNDIITDGNGIKQGDQVIIRFALNQAEATITKIETSYGQ